MSWATRADSYFRKSPELSQLTRVIDFRQSRRLSPQREIPTFFNACARISAQLMALENGRRLARLTDLRYRAYMAGLFWIALTPYAPLPLKKTLKILLVATPFQ
jgi:hypothetical protein